MPIRLTIAFGIAEASTGACNLLALPRYPRLAASLSTLKSWAKN
jgi:hypothetical protein